MTNGAGPPSSLAGLAGAVLNFAQDWRRALILMALGLSALVGVIVYQARERMIIAFEERVRAPAGATLDTAKAPAVAASLLAELPGGPRIVLVLAVDVLANTYWLEGAAAVPEAAAALEAARPTLTAGMPFFSASRGTNAILIGVLNGRIDCGPTATIQRGHNYFVGLGVQSACLAGVPPQVGELVGVILAGYPGPPLEAAEQEMMRPLLTQAGLALVGRAVD